MEQAEPELQQRVGRSKRKKNRRQQEDGDYEVDVESRPGTTTASPRREQSPESSARVLRKRSRSRQPLASNDISQSQSQSASTSASRNHSRVRAHARTLSGTSGAGFFSKVTPGPAEALAPETTLSSASMHALPSDESFRFSSSSSSRGHSRRGSRNQSLTRSSSRPGSSTRSPSVPRYEADYENSPSIASSIQTPLSDQALPQPLTTRSRRHGSSPSPPRSRVPQTPTDEEQPHFAFPPGSASKGRSVSRGRTRVPPPTGMGIGITGQFGVYSYDRLEIVDESSAPVGVPEDPFGRGRGLRSEEVSYRSFR